jgi:hypothetical protein
MGWTRRRSRRRMATLHQPRTSGTTVAIRIKHLLTVGGGPTVPADAPPTEPDYMEGRRWFSVSREGSPFRFHTDDAGRPLVACIKKASANLTFTRESSWRSWLRNSKKRIA